MSTIDITPKWQEAINIYFLVFRSHANKKLTSVLEESKPEFDRMAKVMDTLNEADINSEVLKDLKDLKSQHSDDSYEKSLGLVIDLIANLREVGK